MVVARIGGAFAAAILVGWMLGKPTPGISISREAAMTEKVRSVAEIAGSILPKDMGEGVTMRSARADRTTLVVAIDGLPRWEPVLSTAEMTKMMAKSACQHPGFRSMVKDGAFIRMDATTPGGEALPPLWIKECV